MSVVYGNLPEEAAKQMRSRGKVLKGKDGESYQVGPKRAEQCGDLDMHPLQACGLTVILLSSCHRKAAVLCHGRELCHSSKEPPHSHSALQLQIL